MQLQTYISPCPNDTFVFEAMLFGKVRNTNNITYQYHLHDIELLNNIALQGTADIIKISFALWPMVMENYDLLPVGAALGIDVGPLFISKTEDINLTNTELKIAIPGELTTAHFLLKYLYPHLTNKKAILFSNIEHEILNGVFDAGVIIHENRFTYADRGLYCIADLGKLWYSKTGLPIPLGGIVIKKSLPTEIKDTVAAQLLQSIEIAWSQYPKLPSFIMNNAQEMSEEIMRKHINLYVNDYTKDIGEKGLAAIRLMSTA